MLLSSPGKGTTLKLDCLFHLKGFCQADDITYREGHLLAFLIKSCEQNSELTIQTPSIRNLLVIRTDRAIRDDLTNQVIDVQIILQSEIAFVLLALYSLQVDFAGLQ